SDPAAIGTRDRWRQLVQSNGLRFRGHKLVRDTARADLPVADSVSAGSEVGTLPTPSASAPMHTNSLSNLAFAPLQEHLPSAAAPDIRGATAKRCKHGVIVGACAICR